MHAPCHRSLALTLLQHVLNVRHPGPRRQRFEGKIAALSDATDEKVAPMPHQAELVETGYATADLHGQGVTPRRAGHSIFTLRRPRGGASQHRIV